MIITTSYCLSFHMVTSSFWASCLFCSSSSLSISSITCLAISSSSSALTNTITNHTLSITTNTESISTKVVKQSFSKRVKWYDNGIVLQNSNTMYRYSQWVEAKRQKKMEGDRLRETDRGRENEQERNRETMLMEN